jgi:hypothetical protein
LPTLDWATGSGAKMSAATERPILVDETVACFWLKHWTRSIGIFGQRFSTGGEKGPGGNDRFAFGQIWSASGQFEMTTFRLAHAIALDRLLRKIDIHLSHFRQRAL